MKKRIIASITALAMYLLATSSYADSIVHIWNCKLNDGKTTENLAAVTSDWLKAAKTMEGGGALELYLEFPEAAAVGDGSFSFVLVAPDTKTWGLFMNDYPESPAAKADEAWGEVATCSGSSLWRSVAFE